MLPAEKAQGQIWLREEFLCDVQYEISEPLKNSRNSHVQRIVLIVPEAHCAMLLDAYELTLVLDNGQRQHIPRPFHYKGGTSFECYVES